MATKYRPRDETARIIWDDLKAHGDSESWQIRRRTGLTYTQFWYGMGYLKDQMQTDNGQPLIYMTHQGVYSLTKNEADWREYVQETRMRSIVTQLRRVEETARAGGMAFGTRTAANRALIRGITALRQAAEAMLP